MNKKIKRIVVSVFALCTSLLLVTHSVSAMEAFTIDNVVVDMSVHEDGGIDVKETYDLDFSQPRHGFIRYIPNTYDMKFTDNGVTSTKHYYFPVSEVKSSRPFDMEGNTKGISVKIGDPDETVIGKQQYVIQYHVQTKDLRLKSGAQALYWNLVGGFDTPIKKMSYRIQMPKAFDAKNVFTYSSAYGSTSSQLRANVDGNVITGQMNGVLYNNEYATIKVNLPNGYFKFPPIKDYTVLNTILSAVLVLIFFLLFLKFGKDDDIVVTVEFKAPDGMNSAEVGFVIDDMVQNKDIVSLIIDWANRGFLLIHDEKKGFTLEKVKEMTAENSKEYERVFFDAIFKEKNAVNEDDMKAQKVGNALQNAKTMLHYYFNRNAKRRIYSNTSLALQVVMVFVVMIPSLLFSVLAAHETFGLLYIYFMYLIPAVLLGVSTIAWIFIMRFRYTMKRATLFIASVVCIVVEAILLIANAFTQFLSGVSVVGMIVSALATVILIILMIFMEKRTKQGNIWLGKILGFKDFILNCEKEKLEMLVKDDPSMFYAILPYAYVMGISDVWVKKFESISIVAPDWYMGYHGDLFTTILWWNTFRYCFSSISSASSFVPTSTTGIGGGSFGGGGFGGGGGFSGGGFGGGGGGSW